jgi:hypothetical protein
VQAVGRFGKGGWSTVGREMIVAPLPQGQWRQETAVASAVGREMIVAPLPQGQWRQETAVASAVGGVMIRQETAVASAVGGVLITAASSPERRRRTGRLQLSAYGALYGACR